MGKLYELKEKALSIIKEKNLDTVAFCGRIGLKAGLMLPFVKQETPDDPTKISNLRKAIKEVLNVDV
jgi:hypothetical protein